MFMWIGASSEVMSFNSDSFCRLPWCRHPLSSWTFLPPNIYRTLMKAKHSTSSPEWKEVKTQSACDLYTKMCFTCWIDLLGKKIVLLIFTTFHFIHTTPQWTWTVDRGPDECRWCCVRMLNRDRKEHQEDIWFYGATGAFQEHIGLREYGSVFLCCIPNRQGLLPSVDEHACVDLGTTWQQENQWETVRQ